MRNTGQRKLTKAQIAKLSAKRQVITEVTDEITDIYFRLRTKSPQDKKLYAVTEMLSIITILLADVVVSATKEN